MLYITGAAHAGEAKKANPRADYIRSHYTKYELRIPMRDGVRLHTTVFAPRDVSQPYPFLMIRTPYSCNPYGSDRYPKQIGPSAAHEREGFIFVCQDVRGRMMSEGDFVHMRPIQADRAGAVDEATDAYDTIAWLLERWPNHNGKGVPIRHGRGRSERGLVKGMGEVVRFW